MAEIRTAAHHTVRAGAGPARIVDRADGVVARVEPVRAPLPDLAGPVVEGVSVRRERTHRRCARIAVGLRVLAGEGPLEHVHPLLATRFALIAPWVMLL